MNTLLLSMQNLKTFIKQKTLLFFIILLGLSVSVSAILFYSGYFINNFENATGTNDLTLKIKIDEDSIAPLDFENIVEANFSASPKRIMFFEDDPDDYQETNQNRKVYYVGDRYFSNLPKNLLLYGNYMDDGGENELLVTSSALKILGIKSVHNNITIDDTTYTIAGLISPFYYLPYSDNCIVFPLQDYIKKHTVNYVEILYDHSTTKKQINEINETLSNIKGIDIIHLPSTSNPLKSTRFLSLLFQIILIFLLSFINVISLFYFWTKSNKRVYDIYHFSGANRYTITAIVIINNITITLSGIVLGTIFFDVISPFLLSYDIVANFSMSRYGFILLILIILSILLAILCSIRYTRENQIYKISGE